MYTLHQKKVTFNVSICPCAPGSLTLTDGLNDSVITNFDNDPGSLTLISGHQEKSMKKMQLSFGEECKSSDKFGHGYIRLWHWLWFLSIKLWLSSLIMCTYKASKQLEPRLADGLAPTLRLLSHVGFGSMQVSGWRPLLSMNCTRICVSMALMP